MKKTRANITDNNGEVLKQVEGFKNSGAIVSKGGCSQSAVRAKDKSKWNKWREIAGVFSDKCL